MRIWTHITTKDEREYEVELDVMHYAGSPGSYWEPPSGPEVEIDCVKVRWSSGGPLVELEWGPYDVFEKLLYDYDAFYEEVLNKACDVWQEDGPHD